MGVERTFLLPKFLNRHCPVVRFICPHLLLSLQQAVNTLEVNPN